MNMYQHIKKHLNVQTAGHVVMSAFAAASLANVESFFATLHPGLPALSWGLGVALGLGLVVMAGLLSGMMWDWRDARFVVVLSVTAGLALLSGGIQGAAYDAHMQSILAAYVLGLALPVIGELGVALAVSAYSQAQRRQRMADAQTQLADGVRAQIGEAIATIDAAKVRAQVERAAALITREIVDATVQDMIADLHRGRAIVRTDDNTHQITTNGEESTPTFGPQNLPAANDVRRQLVEERRAAIVHLCESYGAMGAPDLAKRLRDDRGIVASTQTVRDDCNALVEAGQLVAVGRKWDVPRTISATLPTAPAPVLNGHGQH